MNFQKYKNYDIAILILRLGFGLGFFIFHGWSKLIGGPEKWAKVGSVMSDVGINFGHSFFGFLAAFSETIGALMIAFGFRMEIFSLMIAFTMFMASWKHIFGTGSAGNALKYFAVAMSLFYFDAGKYSVDAYLKKKSN